jgi:formate--tetrahydrofolate ligase
MKEDIEIARVARMATMEEIASKAGLTGDQVMSCGLNKSKVLVDDLDLTKRSGKLILVTAMSPTPTGEGKTTVSIGLAMALSRLGHRTVVGLRQPSLGPVFGIKGGAAGGGRSQVLPMEDINLHFTGDMHAITSAHNLLSALINNSMHFDNELNLDSRKITWPRVVDMNDRSLRQVVVGLGNKFGGMVDEDNFDITAASEVMACLCLCEDHRDLRERIDRIMIGFSTDDTPRYCSDMRAAGAMTVLLTDAIRPNLVQTIENTPALIHGGPFANIAHGTSSLIAARLGLNLADYYVTEAGFGSDLGGEKFFDIFCRISGLPVAAVVLVATVKALKYHGSVKKKQLATENAAAVESGFPNLRKHISNIRAFGFTPVVALNVRATDTKAELDKTQELCDTEGVQCIETRVHGEGSEGGIELAEAIVSNAQNREPTFTYELGLPLKEKMDILASKVYGAETVVYSPEAKKDLRLWEKLGYGTLPLCVAKTQYSFSDDKKLLGAPTGYEMHIREVRLSSGAGFVIPIAGEIMTMPGLPRHPAAETIDMDADGNIHGLF